MTDEEKRLELLWEYINEESDSLLVELRERIDKDGFHQAMPNKMDGTTDLLMNISIALHVKVLIMACESAGHPIPTLAFKKVSLPQQLRILNYYSVKMWEKQLEEGKK